MARSALVLLAVVAVTTAAGTTRADDAILTARVGTPQGASAAGTLVFGRPWCFFGCSGSGGLALELEAGLSGAKARLVSGSQIAEMERVS